MALIKCKECGKEISSDAEACPHCGKKIVRTSGCALAVLIFIVVGIGLSVFRPTPTSTPPAKVASPEPPPKPAEPPPPPTPKELAKAKADKAARDATEKKVYALKDNSFCVEVGRNLRQKEKKQPYTEVLMERASRKFDVVALDYSYIQQRDLRAGMSWCAVFAAWGLPQHGNKTSSARGTRYQLVYGNRRYAYIDNDVLTAWQE